MCQAPAQTKLFGSFPRDQHCDGPDPMPEQAEGDGHAADDSQGEIGPGRTSGRLGRCAAGFGRLFQGGLCPLSALPSP